VATAEISGPSLDVPRRRRLRTFAFDPMSSRLSGRYLTVSVPYEAKLNAGPSGELVQVVDYDPVHQKWYAQINLDDPYILAQDGLEPAEGDPRTHQQIVYAVAGGVLERFERYLGRRFRWRGVKRLRLVPHAFEGRNAFFDPGREAVLFGYFPADESDPGANLPGQIIFTCLSSDIIAHEVTHAIVHRLRRHFSEATNPDVFAWHEAFADLIALFQHFRYHDVVLDAVTKTAGQIDKGSVLFDLASEFGRSSGRGAALRSAIDPAKTREQQRTPERFRKATEPHERGACFVAAVFDAYLDRFQASIADLLRIATAGTGVLPAGHLHPDLVERVTTEAIVCADQHLRLVVRAFDYLPPVDVTFGDVVRAIVTADYSLYPDDDINLRGGLVESLRRRGIYPEQVISLTEEALLWATPVTELSLTPDVPVADLIVEATMNLDTASERGELPDSFYQKLHTWATTNALAIGLDPDETIAVESVHVTFRQADDRQPRPEIVIELVQRRADLEEAEQPDLPKKMRTPLRAGTTLIARVSGQIDYVVTKPLPFKTIPVDREFLDLHERGVKRLDDMRKWFSQVDQDDPLAPWQREPAVGRLDFAGLHCDDTETS
jgi:hypothetical protein